MLGSQPCCPSTKRKNRCKALGRLCTAGTYEWGCCPWPEATPSSTIARPSKLKREAQLGEGAKDNRIRNPTDIPCTIPRLVVLNLPVISGRNSQPVSLIEKVGAASLVPVVHLGGEGDGDTGAGGEGHYPTRLDVVGFGGN